MKYISPNYLDDGRPRCDYYTPVCTIDFDSYSKELKNVEFSATPYYGEHGRLLCWNFVRGANVERTDHQCVSMLTVNIGGAAEAAKRR